MTNRKYIIVGVGELLWDLLPSGQQLGGAPANFAYVSHLLGDEGIPASRVARDSLGEEALQRLRQLGLNTAYIQQDSYHPTGTVKVELAADGQPRFEITHPVAWDFLEWSSTWQELAANVDAVCFGSLAQRSSPSRTTIRNFLQAARPEAVRVFDVNMRQNFYNAQILMESTRLANIVKLNHEELPKIMDRFGLDHQNEEASARHLLSSYDLRMVCITRGRNGSLLVSPNEHSEHPGFKVKVVDTIGAGDAFTAGLVHGYLRGASLDQINDAANRAGAWVASQSGAMPVVSGAGLAHVLAEIK